MVKAEELQRFLEEFKGQINREAETMKELGMPQITEELFALFEQTGNRLKYEDVYFTRRKFLAVYGLKALAEKQEQNVVSSDVITKLEEVINGICDEECWALPAHVDRREQQWQVTVDLFAAETSQTLAELDDRLGKELSDEVHCRIVKNIEWRVFRPFFTSPVPYRNWEHSENNWNAVCSGAIGSACLHLMKNQKDYLELCLDRICDSLPYYISGFAEDGACMEGLGYFTYGMTYFVNFAQELFEYSEGKHDLLRGEWAGFREGEEDKRARIAAFQHKCYFADGRTVSFSDGNSHDRFRVGLSCALSDRFPQALLPAIQRAAGLLDDDCYRFAALKMDLFETQKYLEKRKDMEKAAVSEWKNADIAEGEEKSGCYETGAGDEMKSASCSFDILSSAQWCIGRSASGAGMACKGGNNGEPHNHNDVGHFLYESHGVLLFTDLGAGEYTREYFSEKRYDTLCNNSFGHSVPIIDGKGQCPGREHGCGEFQAAVADKEDGDGREGLVSMELAGAYEAGILESLRRSLRFSLVDGSLEVEDCFTFPEGSCCEAVENLVTQIPPIIRDGKVLLCFRGVRGILSIEGLDAEQAVSVQEYLHSSHKGQQERVYAVQWKVPGMLNCDTDIVQNRQYRCSFRITSESLEK